MREYTTTGECAMQTGTANYGRQPGPKATAHLTDYQRSACESLAEFYVTTEKECRQLLSMWTGRHLLYENDIRAIVREMVGWHGAYTYDREQPDGSPLPAGVVGHPLGRAAS